MGRRSQTGHPADRERLHPVRRRRRPEDVIATGGVANSAGYQAAIAPGAWVAIYGQNFSTTTRTWRADEIRNGVLSTALDGVSVTIDGKAAAVYYISPTQIDVLALADTTTGLVQVWATTPAGSSIPAFVTLQPTAPAVFEVHGSDGTAYAVATRTDYSFAADPAVLPDLHGTPAAPGNYILTSESHIR